MRTILLADDEPGLRALARATLGPSYHILEAVDGAAAVAIALSERPDLVLLDVRMPKLDGLTVCRRIKSSSENKQTIVLMLSGLHSDADASAAYAAGADAYLRKPFSPSALLDAVERSLEHQPAPPTRAHAEADVEPIPSKPRELDQMIIYARELRSLYTSAQSQAARFRQLVEFSRELTGAANVDAVVGLARTRVASMTGYNHAEIILAATAPNDPEPRLVDSVGRGPRPGAGFPDPGAAERAARERRPISESNPRQPEPSTDGGDTAGRSRAMYLPLVTPSGRVVGVLALAVEEDSAPADDLDALQLLAAQLASAIDSAQLNERLQRGVDALLAIHEAGKLLGSKLAPEDVGRHVLDISTRVAGFAAGLIGLKNVDGQLNVWQTIGETELLDAVQRSADASRAREVALETGLAQVFHVAPEGLHGWSLPLRVNDRAIGVLEVFGAAPPVDGEPADVLVSLANQAASGLENARLYRELADREEQLHELVRRLLVAQEEERRRVAYDIHDGLAQTAAAAHRHLQAFAHHYRPRTALARQQLEQATRAAQQTVGEARHVIANLRPTVLDDFGLATAVRLEVDALRSEGWDVVFDEALGSERLPQTTETALYRVAQEAITNIRRHAGVTRAEVTLKRDGSLVHLGVRDWGRGFVPAAPSGGGPGERVGVASMRERVGLLGGQLTIASDVGSGTRIEVRIPWPTAKPADFGREEGSDHAG